MKTIEKIRMQAKDFKKEVLPVSNKLLHFARCFFTDEEIAKDVVQDVMLKLWQKREELVTINNIEAFAMRMTRNRCLDMLRAKRSLSIELDKIKHVEGGDGHLDTRLEHSETTRLVKEIIKQLPDLQRTVIYLRDIEEREFDEIEEITRLSTNAIRVNLSRARKKVREEVIKIQDYGITEN